MSWMSLTIQSNTINPSLGISPSPAPFIRGNQPAPNLPKNVDILKQIYPIGFDRQEYEKSLRNNNTLPIPTNNQKSKKHGGGGRGGGRNRGRGGGRNRGRGGGGKKRGGHSGGGGRGRGGGGGRGGGRGGRGGGRRGDDNTNLNDDNDYFDDDEDDKDEFDDDGNGMSFFDSLKPCKNPKHLKKMGRASVRKRYMIL